MLSNTSKYAVRAVIYLGLKANRKQMIGIKQISRELDIPAPFLSKILQSLAKQKLLYSNKGPNGGFALARDPEKISIMDILKVIDGLDLFKKCVLGVRYCSDQINPCVLHSYYSGLRDEMKKKFEVITLGKIIEEVREGNQEINL
jgi:Rrf2 family protein